MPRTAAPGRRAWALAACALAASLAGVASPSSLRGPLDDGRAADALGRHEFSEPHMGTTVRLVVYAADPDEAARSAAAAFARVADLDRRLSDYREDSELMRACREAVRNPVPVSPDVFRVLERAQQMARRTDGAFDVTAGAMTRLWRRARRLGELPSAGDLAAARAASGYRLLRLGADDQAIWLERPGIRIDVGGMAKGYAADRALEVLRRLGLEHAMVAAGGDLALGEAPPGAQGWRVAIAPLAPGDSGPVTELLLANAGVSTSGDAEQWVEIGGTRYSHILDPRTGHPLTGERTVTVVAPDSTTSDMLATTVAVLGPDAGAALVADTPGASMLMGVRSEDATVRWTSRGTAFLIP